MQSTIPSPRQEIHAVSWELMIRSMAAGAQHRRSLLDGHDGAHAGGDYFLRVKAVTVRRRERLAGLAVLDEGGNLGFIRWPEAIHELRYRLLIVAHCKGAMC